ncbi:MAG: WYL domain-containing protein [Lachnospiraceae bacterium]|nr:WYL domain-containing protein [Lachnospiraceae bacterium]
MSRSENQKKKLITLRDILLQKTDEEHPLTTKQLIDELEKAGISSERKSVYADMETLEELGLDIIKISKASNEYYIGEREFELPELKLLVDVVQAANFITPKKSAELIKKLEAQTSVYRAKQLSRNVVLANRTKTTNENILINVDIIYRAISDNKQIQFLYYDWNLKKELVLRKEKPYQVSPFALIWDDENYYLLGYDSAAGKMKHYRVDKIKRIDELDTAREGKSIFEAIDMAAYSRATFGMFGGEDEIVQIRAKNHFAGVFIDRFGSDVTLRALDDEYFEARVPVRISSQFYGWLTALGEEVSILGPSRVKEDYKAYLNSILKHMD